MTPIACCLQYDESDDQGGPVEASPPAVDVPALLLVHVAPAVATAAAAGEAEAHQGHEHDVDDADGHTNQEANLIEQHLDRHSMALEPRGWVGRVYLCVCVCV